MRHTTPGCILDEVAKSASSDMQTIAGMDRCVSVLVDGSQQPQAITVVSNIVLGLRRFQGFNMDAAAMLAQAGDWQYLEPEDASRRVGYTHPGIRVVAAPVQNMF